MGWSGCDAELWEVIEHGDDPNIDSYFSSGGGKGWVCTKPPDHSGNHIGGDGPISENPTEDNQWIEWNSNGVVRYWVDGIGFDHTARLFEPFIVQELY